MKKRRNPNRQFVIKRVCAQCGNDIPRGAVRCRYCKLKIEGKEDTVRVRISKSELT